MNLIIGYRIEDKTIIQNIGPTKLTHNGTLLIQLGPVIKHVSYHKNSEGIKINMDNAKAILSEIKLKASDMIKKKSQAARIILSNIIFLLDF